jgi:hypothetical protein
MDKLGKLEKVPLRDTWMSEPRNFSKWLAKKENLTLLSETLNIDSLELEATEADIGSFNVDILARDEDKDLVIIENQLEQTDHKHLGQIITYASGKEAKTIIWIAKSFRDEHLKAINWLNENSVDDINFFAIEIELWRIGDSLPAPKFSVVAKPNEWEKIIREPPKLKENTSTELKRFKFWEGLKAFANENGAPFFSHKPSKDHWYNISMGLGGSYISLTALIPNNKITCGLWIDDDKERFDSLEAVKTDIEKELGYPLGWDRKDRKKASSIIVSEDYDFSAENNVEAYQWMVTKAKEFKSVFERYLLEK